MHKAPAWEKLTFRSDEAAGAFQALRRIDNTSAPNLQSPSELGPIQNRTRDCGSAHFAHFLPIYNLYCTAILYHYLFIVSMLMLAVTCLCWEGFSMAVRHSHKKLSPCLAQTLTCVFFFGDFAQEGNSDTLWFIGRTKTLEITAVVALH